MNVTQPFDDMPGPGGAPALMFLRWAPNQAKFFNRQVARYGPAFRANMPLYGPIAVFASSRAAEQILKLPASIARGGEAMKVLRETAGLRSVITSDGDAHLRLRKLILPPLHGERLKRWESFAEQRTLQDIETWPVGEPFPLRATTEQITLSVISKIIFGMSDSSRSDELRRLLPALFNIDPVVAVGFVNRRAQLDLGPWSPWGRFRRKRDRIDELIYSEIAERRGALGAAGAEAGDDMLSMLLEARDEEGKALTDEELRDQLVTMLIAGHETTATSITWAFERLLRAPEVLELLLGALNEGDATYLDAVIKETLRIRPVTAQFGRVLAEDSVIDGWAVPAGTLVAVPQTVLHMDPTIYPDPKSFRPERFLDGEGPGGYEWLPFGGGVRRCPGASLAQMEMRVVIATILRNVRLAADRAKSEKPWTRGITIVPSRGGRVVVTERLRTRSVSGPAEVAA
jgi:cytochrome P450